MSDKYCAVCGEYPTEDLRLFAFEEKIGVYSVSMCEKCYDKLEEKILQIKTLERSSNGNLQTTTETSSELISNLVLNGDISKMPNEMKVEYYNKLCHSLNLNPVTKPFQIISFQNKTIFTQQKTAQNS